jgi:hypothetical protein
MDLAIGLRLVAHLSVSVTLLQNCSLSVTADVMLSRCQHEILTRVAQIYEALLQETVGSANFVI